MEDKLKNLLFKRVPLKILMKIDELDEAYSTTITHEIEGSYSYVVRLVEEFEDLGLVELEERGRKKVIELTQKGERTLDNINQIIGLEDRDEGDTSASMSKLEKIREKIEQIYQEDLKDKESISKKESSRVGKRIGPYKREIRRLEKNSSNEDLIKNINKIKNRVEEIVEIRDEKANKNS